MIKNKLLKILLTFVLAALCAASLCACGNNKSKKSLKNYVTIGRILPLTGKYEGYAQGSLEAEKAAVEELNENGGIFIDALDRKLMVRFLLEDSKSTKEGAEEAARKLIDEENVDVIVVSHTSETVNAVTKICEEKKVPCFCSDSDLESWLGMGSHKYAFNISPSLNSKLDAFKEVWKENGVSILAIIADDSVEGKSFAEHVKKYCSSNQIKTADVNYLADVAKTMKDAKADGMICYMDLEEYTKILTEIKAGGVEIKAGMLVNEQPIQSVLDSSDSYAIFDGSYTDVCWAPSFEYRSSLTDENGEGLKEFWNSEFLSACPESLGFKHVIIEVTVEALKRAMAIDSEAIIEAAGELSINTIIGRVNFEKNYMDPACGAVKWVYDAHLADANKWSQILTPEDFGKE